MSTIGLRAPRVFRLPRIKFKRPRWPKGEPVLLVYAVGNLLCATSGLVEITRGDYGSAVLVGLNAACGVLCGWTWWCSRSDDNGPSAT